MSRIACLTLPEFPLQLLLRRHEDWRTLPAVVVDRDAAQGTVQCANESARARRILPGMRYAAALSLDQQLRAGVVSEDDIAAATDRIAGIVGAFTPGVEPSSTEPGVFWLDASGLSRLYPSLCEWGMDVHNAIGRDRFHCSIAVGFSRFGVYAIARASGATQTAVVVVDSVEDEAARAGRAPIDRLGFTPSLRDALARLGVTTLDGFLMLPGRSVHRRFGADIHRLHQLARGKLFSPLQPRVPNVPATAAAVFDYSESSLDRLMATIEQLFASILRQLGSRENLIAGLTVELAFDDGSHRRTRIEPAAATSDPAFLTELVRLRLQHQSFPSGVSEISLTAQAADAVRRQHDLFERKVSRDLAAAARALSRTRAALGDASVVSARLRDGHLPEAQFEWVAARTVPTPHPRTVVLKPLVRRIYPRPVALSRRRRKEPRAALVGLYEDRLIDERVGPYRVEGGWWVREVGREYYFVRTERGRCLWIYYDLRRQRWFLHGEVE